MYANYDGRDNGSMVRYKWLPEVFMPNYEKLLESENMPHEKPVELVSPIRTARDMCLVLFFIQLSALVNPPLP